jgi:hypothetical protein
MKLSEAYDKYNRATTFSCCTNCKKAWLDDIPIVGVALTCPVGCGLAMLRGAEKPEQYGCKLDDGKDLTSHIEEDPGKQAKNVSSVKSKL